MKCIFCFQESEPSKEHIIPDIIGGALTIDTVCTPCNSLLSKLVDGPFSGCPLVERARFSHSIGGKRGRVPFPFALGTLPTGQKIGLNRDFKPHVKRDLEIKPNRGGGVQVQFSADASDKADFDKMLGKPLRKVLEERFPEWSPDKMDAEIDKVVTHAQLRPQVFDVLITGFKFILR